MPYRRKLIEVALPLEAINIESAREKSIRHGHPSTLHLWWARRPLAACRAVLFSSLVDDPSEYMPDEESARAERERLFKIIEDLVKWENIKNEEVLDKARLEIARSVARNLGVDVPVGKEAIREFLATQAPPVLDPFAGGGSIPLEAQRLGLRAHASDLNPVAVLINKAQIEIPPKFAGMPPVHPPDHSPLPSGKKRKGGKGQGAFWREEWKGAEGLAEDVRYYGKWMRDEAYKRIGHLYPSVKITTELLAERPDLKAQGLKPEDDLTVIAWLWARTVKCPNPACGAKMPLTKTFALSRAKNAEFWIEPTTDNLPEIGYKVIHSKNPPFADGTVNRGGGRCLVCHTPVPFDYIRAQGKLKKMNERMIAIIAEGSRSQIFLSPQKDHVIIADTANPVWFPDQTMPYNPFSVRPPLYGFYKFSDIFTPRQLTSLSTFSELITDAREKILADMQRLSPDRNAQEYANAISIYLSFNISRGANYWSSLTPWGGGFIVQTFGRQALQMTWDFAEANPFSASTGNWLGGIDWIARCLETSISANSVSVAIQSNAVDIKNPSSIISTDPPYYDNVDYADLSDYFYVWLRHSLANIFPDLFSTILVPKKEELVATPYRFEGNRELARSFFEDGLRKVFQKIHAIQADNYPITIYYAFKQAESNTSDNEDIVEKEIVSTGWETMLDGLINSKLLITGTLPLRTEREHGLKASMNALASSIVLVCRPRPEDAPNITRRDFLATLKRELPPALRQLQQGNIAPVDLAQAAIGPGMAVFSRYKQVLEADGSPMRVRTALALINQSLDEFLAEQEGEYDSDTRWALAWYEQYGHDQGPYGVAETLSTAKNTSVNGLVEAGFLEARSGKVCLLRRDELDPNWDPQKDNRPTAWEACQHLIFDLDKTGEQAAAGLLAKLGGLSETARDLAYRLYTICERKGWAQDALGYNMLVVAWPRLRELARNKQEPTQSRLI